MTKNILISIFTLLAAIPSKAQTNARIFTYDAAGNRIAMGVPASQAPESLFDEATDEETPTVAVTANSDGRVQFTARNFCDVDTYSAEVYTAAGQRVATLRPTSSPVSAIDLSAWPSGVYVVDVTVGDRHVIHKIAKE